MPSFAVRKTALRHPTTLKTLHANNDGADAMISSPVNSCGSRTRHDVPQLHRVIFACRRQPFPVRAKRCASRPSQREYHLTGHQQTSKSHGNRDQPREGSEAHKPRNPANPMRLVFVGVLHGGSLSSSHNNQTSINRSTALPPGLPRWFKGLCATLDGN